MHTGDRVVGSVCRCMDCARKRDQRIMRAARRALPETWEALNEALDRVEDVEAELTLAKTTSTTLRSVLRQRGREVLLAEDGAQTH